MPSSAHLLDAPAGKHGFVRVENGRFATDAGPIRFHATNLTAGEFPDARGGGQARRPVGRGSASTACGCISWTRGVNFMPEPTQAILADDTDTQRNLIPTSWTSSTT